MHLDHSSAVRADVSRQNYSVCPRYWYVDATSKCSRCKKMFCFTIADQKRWYEELGFYVDSYAKNCRACRNDERKQKSLRQAYDRDIEATLCSNDIVAKKCLADVIDELCSYNSALPAKLHENRRLLNKQILRLTQQVDK
ncbi:zinc-ribbon domain containing protein [Acaryochloris thomasi]